MIVQDVSEADSVRVRDMLCRAAAAPPLATGSRAAGVRRRRAGQAASDSYAVAASYRLAPGAPEARDASGPRPGAAPYAGPGADAARAGRRQRPALAATPAATRRAPGWRPTCGPTARPCWSASGGVFTFGGLTRDLAALLDRLRFPPAVVVGMSMGAGVAVSLALRQPFRVRGLVLIRPAWLDAGPPGNLLPLIQAGRLLRRHGARAGLARFVADRRVRPRPGAVTGRRGQPGGAVPARRTRSGARIRLIQLPRSTPLRHVRDLRRISVPTVVVGTPSDPSHPFEIARIWASALPVSRLLTAPARDVDPAGYQACLTEACSQLAGQVDGERHIGS